MGTRRRRLALLVAITPTASTSGPPAMLGLALGFVLVVASAGTIWWVRRR